MSVPDFVPEEWPEEQEPDELVPVRSLALPLMGAEQLLKSSFEERTEHPDKSLFLAFDPVSLSVVQLGLYLASRIYGLDLVKPVVDNIYAAVDAQEFCNCSRCKARRKEDDSETQEPDSE